MFWNLSRIWKILGKFRDDKNYKNKIIHGKFVLSQAATIFLL